MFKLKRVKKMYLELNDINAQTTSKQINNTAIHDPIVINGIRVLDIQSPLFLSERQHFITLPLPIALRTDEPHLYIKSTVQTEGS